MLFRSGGAQDYWLHKLVRTTRYNDDAMKNGAARGWLHNWSNMKSGVIDIEAYKQQLTRGGERHIEMNPELIAEFCETIEMLTTRDIKGPFFNNVCFGTMWASSPTTQSPVNYALRITHYELFYRVFDFCHKKTPIFFTHLR